MAKPLIVDAEFAAWCKWSDARVKAYMTALHEYYSKYAKDNVGDAESFSKKAMAHANSVADMQPECIQLKAAWKEIASLNGLEFN